MSTFSFKQFSIDNGNCAMKVGTDGVLLGAWAKGGEKVLDIGTGTGLIALMMAQRYPSSELVGIDIDKETCCQAAANVGASPFADRIKIELCSAQDYPSLTACRFNSIVVNPPFFENSLLPPNQQRSEARHANTLTYDELFSSARQLLLADGVLSAIIPAQCYSSFTSAAALYGFIITRRVDLRTKQTKPISRNLVAFQLNSNTQAVSIQQQCLMTDNNDRSLWYNQLTQDFYIK